MKKKNHRLKSNHIYKIRNSETKRIIKSAPNIPVGPSLFDPEDAVKSSKKT